MMQNQETMKNPSPTNTIYHTEKRKNSGVLFIPSKRSRRAINKEDYLIVCELLLSYGRNNADAEEKVQKISGIEDSDERRIDTLTLDSNYAFLPTFLETSIETYIGRLQNLQELTIWGSRIASLPSSIGLLKNLKVLCFRAPITKLPDEIGDLIHLHKLDLSCCNVTSLPSSIGRLKNLKILDLQATRCTLGLPDEIGDLTSLHEFILYGSGITSLPSSIGQLENLRWLCLDGAKNLSTLPKEFGNLANLKILDLEDCGVTSLPDSIRQLTGLMCLYLGHSNLIEFQREDSDNYLLMLIGSCQSLGYVGCAAYESQNWEKLDHALACNRARARQLPLWGLCDKAPWMASLWPLLLHNVVHSSEMYPEVEAYCAWRDYQVAKPDAIFQLLADSRGFFLETLVDWKHRKVAIA